MCNPRKVTVRLAESINQAWRETVTRTAAAEGEVRELVRTTADIPLDAEMGEMALVMMERLMRGEFEEYDIDWEEDDDGNLRLQLDQVTLIYTPGSHQLEIEARLVELVNAEVQATAEATGMTMGDVAVSAVGRYYDDNWGGHTEERAQRLAQDAAQRRLAAAIEELHQQQHADDLTAAAAEAQADADASAQAELARLQEGVRTALRERLQNILADAEDEVNLTINRLIGEAYRRSLIEVALQNGGRVVSDERSGSVINLELEL